MHSLAQQDKDKMDDGMDKVKGNNGKKSMDTDKNGNYLTNRERVKSGSASSKPRQPGQADIRMVK